MPDVVKALRQTRIFECAFSDVPESYQSQPYNLVAKLRTRENLKANVFFNKVANTFTIRIC